jgi:arylsulfatase A-like enzyme
LLDQVIAPALSSLELPPAGSGELTAFEFPRDAQKFTSPSGSVSSRERSVVFETSKRGYLVNKGLLNIARDDLSEIEIRARIKTGSALRIGLSSGDFIEWKPGRMALANIPVDPQEEYRVYCLNLSQSVFRRSLPSGGKLNKIFLAPGDWPGGEIEIASIRFLGRGARYLKSPYGTGYLTSGEVTRPGFWMPVPGRLSWEIELPSQPTFLRAGVSLFQESRPGIEYEIRIVSAEATTLLKRGILSDSSSWVDLGSLDLSRWSSEKITLEIETRGKEPNTVFWGDPVIQELPRDRFNVVVILEDALRADHLGCYGYDNALTPATDRLAAEGILFETAISQAPMTRPSCPSLSTSLYPAATGVWSFRDFLDERFLTMAEVMRSQGFLTAAYIQNPAGGASAGLYQGFGEFFEGEVVGFKTRHLLPDLVGEWLEQNDQQNFFLYLHLIKPHGPFNPWPPFNSAFRDYDALGTPVEHQHSLDPPDIEHPTRERRIIGYDGEIAANDYYLGEFLDLLRQRDLYEDTLVVILSDHGEFLGEDGRWNHTPPGLLEVIHVPLIFSYPRLWRQSERISAPVQILDVMPTILEMAGISTERLLLQGSSLLPLIEEPDSAFWRARPIFSEELANLKRGKEERGIGSIIWSGRHYLCTNALGDDKDRTWHRLAFEITPEGEIPIEPRGEEMRQAYQLLVDLQNSSAAINRNICKEREKIQQHDPEVIKKLKALGYME